MADMYYISKFHGKTPVTNTILLFFKCLEHLVYYKYLKPSHIPNKTPDLLTWSLSRMGTDLLWFDQRDSSVLLDTGTPPR